MMILSKTTWHYRVYLFTLRLIDTFTDKKGEGGNYESRFRNRTSLCHYIRTIFVYLPLMLFVHSIPTLLGIYLLIYLPINSFGLDLLGGSLVNSLILIGVLSIICLLIGVIAYLGTNFFNKLEERSSTRKDDGFISLTGKWVMAKKAKICPIIKFESTKGVS